MFDQPFPDDPVPLAWVRAQPGPPAYVNVGDALSPFLAAMVSGRTLAPAEFVGAGTRMAAIGTIGQNLRGGEVHVWGSGCSPNSDPTGPGRRPYRPPEDGTRRLWATRGPLSAALLSGGRAPDVPFGDPAALLPRFHPAPVARDPGAGPELGVVLHLSELADRGVVARPRPDSARHRVPADGSVRLITMVAPPTVEAVRDKIDEIRACRRVVSTSLHGFVIAAAYGVPCLYLGADPGPDGLARAALEGPEAERINARFVDLLQGGGAREIVYWRQAKRAETDWDALIRALDAEAVPTPPPDAEALIAACPAGAAPLAPPAGGTIWDHPRIRAVPFHAQPRRPAPPPPPPPSPRLGARLARAARALSRRA